MPKRDPSFMFDGFDGFDLPNTTPTPDILFDRLLHVLKEAELKALLYIIRRTYGFKKSSDAISLSQFLHGITKKDGEVLDHGCGVKDRSTLVRALESLETMGVITSDKAYDPGARQHFTTIYKLRFRKDQGVVGNSDHPPSGKSRRGVVGDSHSQESVNKNKRSNKKETDQPESFEDYGYRLNKQMEPAFKMQGYSLPPDE